jgi:streptogramin lyase
MKISLHYFAFTILFLRINVYPGLSQEVIFNRVSSPAGADFGLVTGITQDSQGYMWLATWTGVYRYDGYNLTSYSDKSLILNPLGDLRIECIYIDHQGFIWFGGHGLYIRRLDPATGIFTDFPFTAGNQINQTSLATAILEDLREAFGWVHILGLTGWILKQENISTTHIIQMIPTA